MPGATPVTTPEEFTVAIDVLDDTHGLDAAGVPLPVNDLVNPIQTFNVPDIVAADTVTVAVMLQLLLFV